MARDKFAQFLCSPTVTQSANDTTTTVEVALPNIPETGQVMAVSKIEWGPFSLVDVNGSWVQGSLATRGDIASGDLHMGNPAVVALKELQTRAAAAGTSIFEPQPQSEHWDPEFLIAHRKLYLYCTSSITAQINKMRCKIWFRFVKVSVQEFMQIFADYEG